MKNISSKYYQNDTYILSNFYEHSVKEGSCHQINLDEFKSERGIENER